MNALFIGLGSIGKKHLAVLQELEPNTKIYALRSGKSENEVAGVLSLYSWDDIPKDIDFTVISNPTALHLETIKRAISLKCPLMIEKPSLMSMDGAHELLQEVEREHVVTYIAYNLRFHPVIQWLKKHLPEKQVYEVQAYCGSYLPEWRPGKDYTKLYSAQKSLGGGVHLDLSHEVDYICWLFGKPLNVHGFARKVSSLEIDSNDMAHYYLQYPDKSIAVTLNYFRRDVKRTLEVVCEDETLYADLANWKVSDSKGNTLFSAIPDIFYTYQEQMTHFLSIVKQNQNSMNTLKESLETLKLCLNFG